ncbi:MAG: hypothetical protein WCJ49_05300 [Deltaproteobacteria bacterium]
MAQDMSAQHLAPQSGGFEPQRAFNWILILSALDTLSSTPETPMPAGSVDMVRLAVEKVQFPRFGTQVIPLRYLNENRKVAGGAVVQANTITVRDFVDQDVFKALNAWMEVVHNTYNGSIGYAANYKSTGTLQLLDPMGNVRGDGIKCIGMWPSEFTATELDYESDVALVKVSLTLQVDKYNMKIDALPTGLNTGTGSR